MTRTAKPYVLALLLTVVGVLPAMGLSLDEAVDAALRHSPMLSAERSTHAAALARTSEAATAYYPSVSVTAGYQRVQERDPLTFAGTSFGDSITDGVTAGVTLQQPVFTGGRIRASVGLTAVAADSTAERVIVARRDLVQRVHGAYWALVEATERVTAIDERVLQVKAAVADTGNRVAAGIVTRTVLLEVQMREAEAELQALRARNARTIAVAQLASLIGIEPDELSNPDTPLPEAPETAVAPVSDFVERALANRADLAVQRHAVARADLERQRAAASRLPQLFVKGSFSVARPAPDVFPAENTFGTTWNIGVYGSYDLGDQPRTAHAVDAAREEASAANARFQGATEAIALEVQTAYTGWKSAVEEIRVAGTIARQATENLTDTRARVANGTALRTDQLDAEALVLEASLAVTSARVGERRAWEALLRAAGELE